MSLDKLGRDRHQLALMERSLGKISKDIALDCPRSFDLYEESGKIIKNKKVERVELEDDLKRIRPDLSEQERIEICLFLRECWHYDYKKRASPEQMLKHSFFSTLVQPSH